MGLRTRLNRVPHRQRRGRLSYRIAHLYNFLLILACIAEAGGDAVDGRCERVV